MVSIKGDCMNNKGDEMKTRIKIKVTPEQSRKVQEIAFANGVYWENGDRSVMNIERPYLYIDYSITYGVSPDGFQIIDNIEVDADLFIRTNGTCEELPERDENGQIRGLWITDVPLTEEAYTKARRIVGYKDPSKNSRTFVTKCNNWLIDDGSGIHDAWFYVWSHPELCNYKAKLTYQEFLDYYDNEKEEFPQLEDIEWIQVDVPVWWPVNFVTWHTSWVSEEKYYYVGQTRYNEAKRFYENSKDFKVTWKLKEKEPNAEFRKEFEDARERG
jgi:hypothetical protein